MLFQLVFTETKHDCTRGRSALGNVLSDQMVGWSVHSSRSSNDGAERRKQTARLIKAAVSMTSLSGITKICDG